MSLDNTSLAPFIGAGIPETPEGFEDSSSDLIANSPLDSENSAEIFSS